MKHATRRLGLFVGVGTAAAAVHFLVVWSMVEHLGLAPLVANPLGWCVALGVSFAGHRFLTFADQRAPLARSARRFLLLSAIGFGVNECAYAVLLGSSGLGYRSALAAVLVGVAGFTYGLGRHWAFLGNRVHVPSPDPHA
jgi:putative flippase GtrA